MSHSTISLVVLGIAVVLFVLNRVSPEIVALGAALAMYATGVIDADQVVKGFGDPAVVFIASLFVVSEALDATGVTTWAGQALLRRAGSRPRLLVMLVLGLAAVVAALITANGAVAALVPVAVMVARRIKRAPSAFLIPWRSPPAPARCWR